jgi:hypothetical protein
MLINYSEWIFTTKFSKTWIKKNEEYAKNDVKYGYFKIKI